MKCVRYSMVIPVYNERDSIAALYSELQAVVGALDAPSEILFVDDGSTDGSRAILEGFQAQDPTVRLVLLDRNRGQSTALVAGFRAARGEFVITMDSDLQNDPADIFRLLPWLTQADVVNGVRARRNDSWVRKISSKIGNGFRNWLTRETVSDVGCSLRVMRAAFLKEVPCFKGMHRFLPTLLRMQGARVVEVPVAHRPRFAGQAKYGIRNRLFVGFVDVLGVCWLQRRKIEYHATCCEASQVECSQAGESPSAQDAASLAEPGLHCMEKAS